MFTILQYLYFIALTYYGFKFLKAPEVEMRVPFGDKEQRMLCSGLEVLVIFMLATGLMGITPLLSVRLAICEILCIMAIRHASDSPIYSLPLKLYTVFLVWTAIGLLYTPMPSYGIRMILKYIYPLFMALMASAIVKDKEVFYAAGIWGRRIAVLSFLVMTVPVLPYLFPGVFWNRAALATNYIVWVPFSLSLYQAGIKRKQNLIYTILFILPALVWVFRTDIFGTSIALAAYFFIKYRVKSAPIIAVIAFMALSALFYIPAVKEKMFMNPNKVTMIDYITGNYDKDNVNTSGRKQGWEDVERWFYNDHELIGSGTGRVQTYFYEEAAGWGRGGQLHNDLLVLRCDNGLLGYGLYLLAYLAILLHAVSIYHKSNLHSVRICALTAGSALFGILVTLYSDNTVSYSMATLAYPFAFYGILLRFWQKEQENEIS